MPQLRFVPAVASALIAGFLFFPMPTNADTLSCSSVNGATRCVGSDGLDCHTVEGRMVCAPGAKGHCETVGDVTTCTNGSVRQSFRTGPPNPAPPDDNPAR
jgi:hypothetical protein